ncbi:MAG TPA: hypothetical protein VMU83_21780 [Hanamia sp.]|nr:hypothetical protein [Hanamia sp.]
MDHHNPWAFYVVLNNYLEDPWLINLPLVERRGWPILCRNVSSLLCSGIPEKPAENDLVFSSPSLAYFAPESLAYFTPEYAPGELGGVVLVLLDTILR